MSVGLSRKSGSSFCRPSCILSLSVDKFFKKDFFFSEMAKGKEESGKDSISYRHIVTDIIVSHLFFSTASILCRDKETEALGV